MVAQDISIGAFVASYIVFILALLVFSIIVAIKIVGKTGYPGALGLLFFVPIANIVISITLAFSEWPIEKKLKELKGKLQEQNIPI